MNDRISQLRQQSLNAIPSVSLERAELLTEFYKSGEADKVSVPVARARAFHYLLSRKTICINTGELIVGERGPEPKATPTYPEICTHSQKDFKILNDREKIPFRIDKKTASIQNKTINPFWQGRSIRDRILNSVGEDWLKAYEAGVFTEFMEQRAPGHTVLDDKIYRKGIHDFQKEIENQIDQLDYYNDPDATNKHDELRAISITGDALIVFAERHAEMLESLARAEKNGNRKKELVKMARICRKVPANKPDTFWEALQYYWFVHLGVITELNTWDSFNPGRLDQHLLTFYRNDLKSGVLTEVDARELLQAFWIKFNNQPAPPKVGITAKESNTYTDFCLINVGGVNESGQDAVNELSFIILDIIEEMRLLQPSSMVQISRRNPDNFLHRALKIIRTGYGQPSVFNSDAIIQELVRQGKSLQDARNGGASGCVEAGAFGKESYVLTGYFNIPKILEITMYNGIDPESGNLIGIQSGDVGSFKTFGDFLAAFHSQLKYFIDIKIKGNRIIEKLWSELLPSPFMSLLIDDCIINGKDYNAGGARYNSSYIQGVGLGSVTDSLTSIKYNVYDKQHVSMKDLLKALKTNFEKSGDLRKLLKDGTPKYGNDDDYADDILQDVFEMYFQTIDGRPNTKGGAYRVNLLPTTCHVYFGSVIGALPDGRYAGVPLSEGISPVQGADRNGPTAVMNSAAKIDHLRTGGTLLNQKFTPQVLAREEGIIKLGQLIRSYFKMDGHHIQFNVVTAETLKKAQKNPENYRDLIVRVAGYSDYFVDLTDDLQSEIIKRTEQLL
ncbi:MAG: trans-4-hydroxy-L-proline dehydratase [Candidatus Neomarinimicrobiota bacterium]